MAGLVAVGILADDARDIHAPVRHVRILREQIVQSADERLAPAVQFHHARNIVEDREHVLPRIGLGKIPGGVGVAGGNFLGIERLEEGAIRLGRAEKPRLGIEHILKTLRTLREQLRVVGFAQRLGHLGDAPVIVGEFQRPRGGLRLPRHERNVAVFLVFPLTVAVAHRRGAHRLIGRLRVKTVKTLFKGVVNHRHRMKSDHAIRLIAGKRPHGQQMPVGLRVKGQQTAHKAIHPFRLHERQQRMLRPESVPQREGGIVLEVFTGVNLLVGAAIRAVRIVVQGGRQHGVVHGGVKRLADIGIGRFHRDAREILVPAHLCRLPHGVKIPARHFRLQIFLRLLNARGREPHPQNYLLPGGGGVVQMTANALARGLPHTVRQRLAFELQTEMTERLRTFDDEVCLLDLRPAGALAVTRNPVVAIHGHRRLNRPVANGMFQINQNVACLRRRKRVAMHPGVIGGREFGQHVVLVEQHPVVARLRQFVVVRKMRLKAGAVQRLIIRARIQRTGQRQHQQFRQLRTARARNVRVTETHDRRVRIIISAARIPRARARVRTELHKPKRHGRPRICVTMTGRAHHGQGFVDRFGRGGRR